MTSSSRWSSFSMSARVWRRGVPVVPPKQAVTLRAPDGRLRWRARGWEVPDVPADLVRDLYRVGADDDTPRRIVTYTGPRTARCLIATSQGEVTRAGSTSAYRTGDRILLVRGRLHVLERAMYEDLGFTHASRRLDRLSRIVPRAGGLVRLSGALVPLILVVLGAVGAIWGYIEIGRSIDVARAVAREEGSPFAEPNVAQRIWSTAALFFGTYLPLTDAPVPPPNTAAPGLIAVSTTTSAVVAVVIRAGRGVLGVVASYVRRPDLVVFGSGESAAAIIRSAVDQGMSCVLITEEAHGSAAALAPPGTTVVESPLVPERLPLLARNAVRRGHYVITATQTDAVNLELRDALTALLDRRTSDDDHDAFYVAVVSSYLTADVLRPALIGTDELPAVPISDVSCPVENVVEHLLHVVEAFATPPRTNNPGVTVAVETVGQGSRAASDLIGCLELWLPRLSAAMSHVRLDGPDGSGTHDGTSRAFPLIRFETPTAPDGAVATLAGDASRSVDGRPEQPTVRLLVGPGPEVAAEAVRRREMVRRGTTPVREELVVAVAPDGLLAPAEVETTTSWLRRVGRHSDQVGPGVLVADPDRLGFDATLVTDDLGTQWARAFHQIYCLIYGSAPEPWDRDPRARRDPFRVKTVSNQASSRQAAQFMVTQLLKEGWELARTDVPGRGPHELAERACRDLVERIARAEHEDWRTNRRFVDLTRRAGPLRRRGRRRLVSELSSGGWGAHTWDALTTETADESDEQRRRREGTAEYNRRIVRETYPALAAYFGYEIRRQVTPHTRRTDGEDRG